MRHLICIEETGHTIFDTENIIVDCVDRVIDRHSLTHDLADVRRLKFRVPVGWRELVERQKQYRKKSGTSQSLCDNNS